MTRRHFLAASGGAHLLLGSTPSGTPREVALAINLGGRHVCSFQNGYLLVSEVDRLTLTVVDVKGNFAGSFRPSLAEAAVTALLHGAVSPDGTVVVAAEAQSADGRYANLLVFTDCKGSLRRVVRTNPFAAIRPRFLSDRRLPCVGRELDGQLDEVPGFHLFRFYSPRAGC